MQLNKIKYNSDEDGFSLKFTLLERKNVKQLSAQTPINSSLSSIALVLVEVVVIVSVQDTF